jgi:hypothetical protein
LGTICVSKLPLAYCVVLPASLLRKLRRLWFVYINQLSSSSSCLHSQFATTLQCKRADNMANIDEPTVDGPISLCLTLQGRKSITIAGTRSFLSTALKRKRTAYIMLCLPTICQHGLERQLSRLSGSFGHCMCAHCARRAGGCTIPGKGECSRGSLLRSCIKPGFVCSYERHQGRFQISALEIQVRGRWHQLSWSQVRASVL